MRENVTHPLRVVVNDERFVSEAHLVASLAGLYVRKNEWKLPVAILCDDYLDRSGRLLGLVRDAAAEQSRFHGETRPCPNCNGVGKVRDSMSRHPYPCGRCDGRGVIPDEPRFHGDS